MKNNKELLHSITQSVVDSFKEHDISILDACMGSGKTTYMLKWMESECTDNSLTKILFASPLLSEVGNPEGSTEEERIGRIGLACPSCNFKAPTPQPTKRDHLKQLLSAGENIAITHALLSDIDKDAIELIREQGYIVIIDETLEAVDGYRGLSNGDTLVLEHQIEVQDDCRVKWIGDTGHRYDDVQRLCEENRLYHFHGQYFMSEVNPDLLFAAKRVVVMTYLFRSSVMELWMKANGLSYWYMDNAALGLRPEYELKVEAAKLIEFIEGTAKNHIETKFSRKSLTYTGYKNMGVDDLRAMSEQLKNLTHRGPHKTPARDVMWTCPKDNRTSISGKGFAKGWVHCNARATNAYAHKSTLMYLLDRRMHPNLSTFFTNKGIDVDQEAYALSELIQWVWRSRIRNGKPIKLFIPNPRMKALIKDWLGV